MLIWVYVLISVLIVSLVSLIGILSLSIKESLLNRLLLFFVSLSAGTLIGDAFIHLLPESVELNEGFILRVSLSVLSGIIFFFVLETYIHWRHCHVPTSESHPHHLAWMNLVGDGVHNFIDGLIIAASYLASIPTGIATTIAVIFHEVPQEIGDFGVLIYSGVSKWRALFFNFLSALFAVLGAIVGLVFAAKSQAFLGLIIPFAAGGFIYIAGTDLIPELHKSCANPRQSLWQFLALVLGIAVVLLVGLVE